MAHNELLSIPIISVDSANKLLQDLGLDSKNKKEHDHYGDTEITAYDRSKILVREQAKRVRMANFELLRRVDSASKENFKSADTLRRTFITGLMCTLRALDHELGAAFINHLANLDEGGLNVFERTLVRNPRIQLHEDLLDEVIHGPELPPDEDELRRAIDIISLRAVSTDFSDKLRLGAALGYLAFTTAVKKPEVSSGRFMPEIQTEQVTEQPYMINTGNITPTRVEIAENN